jgi:GMP synthase-like glutamine amidotransferase
MDVLVVMNDMISPAGLVGDAIIAEGGFYEVVAPLNGYASRTPVGRHPVPSGADHDALVVLGGPMSANDEAGHPWIPDVIDLLRAYRAADKPVLGICLGAQLIARAFGGRVRRAADLEIGFVPIRYTEAGHGDPVLGGLGPELCLMQWHEDTIDLPPEAELLVTGDFTPTQAFRVGPKVYGFQFHPETTADIARGWVRAWGERMLEREPGFFARFEAELRAHQAGQAAFIRAAVARWMALGRR